MDATTFLVNKKVFSVEKTSVVMYRNAPEIRLYHPTVTVWKEVSPLACFQDQKDRTPKKINGRDIDFCHVLVLQSQLVARPLKIVRL